MRNNSGRFIRTVWPIADKNSFGYEAQINGWGNDPHRNGSLYLGNECLVSVLDSNTYPEMFFLPVFIAGGNRLVTKVNG